MKFRTFITTVISCALVSSAALAQSEHSASDPRYQDAVDRLNKAQQDYSDEYHRITALEDKLRTATGRVDVSRKDLEGYVEKLQSDLDVLTLERVGSQARMKALEDAIAAELNTAEKASQKDPVVEELQKVADARAQQLELLQRQKNAGAVANATLQDAVAAFADARAKVAERREAVLSGAGGDAATSLKREMVNLSIAERERTAKIDFLHHELARIQPEMDDSRQLDLEGYELARLDQQVRGARMSLNLLGAQYRRQGRPATRPSRGNSSNRGVRN